MFWPSRFIKWRCTSWLRQAGGGVRGDSDIVLRHVSGKVRRVNHEELLKNARGLIEAGWCGPVLAELALFLGQ